MIADLLRTKKNVLSLEVFPPKKEADFPDAFEKLNAFAALKPDFISVTYGAGGGNSKKTVEIASYIHNRLHIPALAHLTCVGNTREDISSVASALEEAGVGHVMALRGDRPARMTDEQFSSREFTHASDLIRYLKSSSLLEMGGAAYPEKHFEALSMKEDILHLKKKVEAGCSFLTTQLFFDNGFFYRFREALEIAGISVPVTAGIMPITSAKQLGTTVSLSGSSVPKRLADILAAYGDNAGDMRKAGIEFAVNQILDLQKNGADGIHLYSMNKPGVTGEIMEAVR